MRKSRVSQGQRAFSLIELLVVVTIITLLMSIGIVSYRQAGIRARNGKRQTDLESLRQALVLYRSDQGSYPEGDGSDSSVDDVILVLSPDYLNADNLEDPRADADASYFYSYESFDNERRFEVCAFLEPDGPDGTPYCVSSP